MLLASSTALTAVARIGDVGLERHDQIRAGQVLHLVRDVLGDDAVAIAHQDVDEGTADTAGGTGDDGDG